MYFLYFLYYCIKICISIFKGFALFPALRIGIVNDILMYVFILDIIAQKIHQYIIHYPYVQDVKITQIL